MCSGPCRSRPRRSGSGGSRNPWPEVGAEEEGEAEGDDPHYQEVATKLDLAKAYEEMGDKEGARELLQEVLSEGNEEQQQKAQELMTLVSA